LRKSGYAGQPETSDTLAKDLQAPLIPSRVCATIERQASIKLEPSWH
jgi:hypothetical protein